MCRWGSPPQHEALYHRVPPGIRTVECPWLRVEESALWGGWLGAWGSSAGEKGWAAFHHWHHTQQRFALSVRLAPEFWGAQLGARRCLVPTLALPPAFSGSGVQLLDLTWPGSLEEVLLAVSSTGSSWPAGTVLFFWPSSFPSLCQMHGHREERWVCGMELRALLILLSVVGLSSLCPLAQGT